MDTRATLRQVPSLAPIATGLIARITITNHPIAGPLFVGGASATVLGNKVQSEDDRCNS